MRAASRARAAVMHFSMIRRASEGCSSRYCARPSADGRLGDALDLGVAEARLGLALELRLRQLDADHGRQALADVLTGEVGVVVLEQLVLAGVVVEDARQGRAEAGHVAAAVDRVDAVGEAGDGLVERRVVLDGALHVDAVELALDVDRAAEQHLAALVEVAHEALDAALEVEGRCPCPARSSTNESQMPFVR